MSTDLSHFTFTPMQSFADVDLTLPLHKVAIVTKPVS